jgi:ribosomal protein S18 acetylase RimI-like enzyme
MPDFTFDPPTAAAPNLLQTVRMSEAEHALGAARWHVAADPSEGIVQVLDFAIEPPYRRRGHGKRLLAALVEQWGAYHRAREIPLRSAWLTLGHKRHVIARAFFMSQGFTHVATIKDLLRDEDALVYVRTFN